jgi:hypothetical protein
MAAGAWAAARTMRRALFSDEDGRPGRAGAASAGQQASRRTQLSSDVLGGERSHPRPRLQRKEGEGARQGKWCILRQRSQRGSDAAGMARARDRGKERRTGAKTARARSLNSCMASSSTPPRRSPSRNSSHHAVVSALLLGTACGAVLTAAANLSSRPTTTSACGRRLRCCEPAPRT